MAILELPPGTPIDFETVTVDSTTVADVLTAAEYGDTDTGGQARHATAAWITVGTDAILFTVDGTDPTTNGHPAAVNDQIRLLGIDQIKGFKAVKVTNNVTLRVTYFRGR